MRDVNPRSPDGTESAVLEEPRRRGRVADQMRARLLPWVGRSITGIAILHLATGPVFYSDSLHSIWQGGLVNAVLRDPAAEPLRSGGYWYVGTGLAVLSLGLVVSWSSRRHHEVPRRLGWLLLGTTVYGVLLMPSSGFWLLLIPATLTFLCSSRAQDAQPGSAVQGGHG